MSTFGIKRLALEWDGALGDIAARYVATGIFTMDTPSNRDDGRFTSGHLALLRDLSRDGQLDDLICIDREEHGANWQDRDRIMANEVIRHTGDPLLVVAGNLHTRLEEQNLDDEFPDFQPMGSFIKEKFPELTTIKITYGSGSYMNIGLQTFVDSHVSDAPYLSKIGKEEFSFSIPYAHPAILPDK